MTKNPFQILVNGSTAEAKLVVLLEEAESTGTVSKAWAGFCSEAVLGMFRQRGLERLPEEVYASAITNLTSSQ